MQDGRIAREFVRPADAAVPVGALR